MLAHVRVRVYVWEGGGENLYFQLREAFSFGRFDRKYNYGLSSLNANQA